MERPRFCVGAWRLAGPRRRGRNGPQDCQGSACAPTPARVTPRSPVCSGLALALGTPVPACLPGPGEGQQGVSEVSLCRGDQRTPQDVGCCCVDLASWAGWVLAAGPAVHSLRPGHPAQTLGSAERDSQPLSTNNRSSWGSVPDGRPRRARQACGSAPAPHRGQGRQRALGRAADSRAAPGLRPRGARNPSLHQHTEGGIKRWTGRAPAWGVWWTGTPEQRWGHSALQWTFTSTAPVSSR